MKAACLWCPDTLTFDPRKGWVHSNGYAYVGECRCDVTAPHTYSHTATGSLQCRSWRDHHVATPNRSVVPA